MTPGEILLILPFLTPNVNAEYISGHCDGSVRPALYISQVVCVGSSTPVWRVTRAVAVAVTLRPSGLVPSVVAVFRMDMATMSAWVTVCVPAQVSVAPGASVAGCEGVQTRTPSSGSLIVTLFSVTLPVFFATSV